MSDASESEVPEVVTESEPKKKKAKKRPSDFEITRTILQRTHERKLPYLLKNMGEDSDILFFCSKDESEFTYGSPDISVAIFEFTDPELAAVITECMGKLHGLQTDHGNQCIINVRDQMSDLAKSKGEAMDADVVSNEHGSVWTVRKDVNGKEKTTYFSKAIESLFHMQLVKSWCEEYRPLLTTQDPAHLYYPYRHPEGDTASIMTLPASDDVNHPMAMLYPHGFRAMATRGLDVLLDKFLEEFPYPVVQEDVIVFQDQSAACPDGASHYCARLANDLGSSQCHVLSHPYHRPSFNRKSPVMTTEASGEDDHESVPPLTQQEPTQQQVDNFITETAKVGDEELAPPLGSTLPEAPAAAPEEDVVLTTAATVTPTAEEDEFSNRVVYPEDRIDLRGENLDKLADLVKDRQDEIGPDSLDVRTKTVGSWENIMFRALTEPNLEEMRSQAALGTLSPDERVSLSYLYREDDKVKLRSATSIGSPVQAGDTKTLTGDAAKMAFECLDKGGGFRIPLYNSGITLDMIVPTGNDIQTLLTNSLLVDNQLGTSSGAHYFTHQDLVYKTQILNFIRPLIVGSSYTDWRKKDKLWSVIKLPDLPAIMATLAALCYPDGFDGFMTKCTRERTEDHPNHCGHVETLKIDIFKMIVTRYAVLSKDSIDHMAAARMGNASHGIGAIAKYQSDLGLEGEKISFGNISFIMRIPTLAENLEAGSKFIADIINEIDGDNTDGRYEQFGFRYIRTFLPFIAAVEKKSTDGTRSVKTSDQDVIVRELEKLDDNDNDGKVPETLRKYIDKVQLTYVGYPVIACPACGYTADTPSGMWTFDPFSAFFTLALRYLNQAV